MAPSGRRVWAVAAASGVAGLLAWMALWTPPSPWTEQPWAVRGLGAVIGAWVWTILFALVRWRRAPAPWHARARHIAAWIITAAACWFIGHGAAAFWLKSDFWFVALKAHAWPVLACAAAVAVVSGIRRRSGTVPHCARCDYEKAAGSAPVCPECGADWDAERGVVLGTRRWWWRRIGAGAVVLAGVYPLARYVDTIPGGGLCMRICEWLPSDLLIHLATPEGLGGRKDFHTWSVLTYRDLSPRQERLLARRVLASRRWRGVLSLCAEPWIAERCMAGALPQPVIDAYFAGVAEASLRAIPEPDGTVTVSVEGVYRPILSYNPLGGRSTPYVPRLYFGGFDGPALGADAVGRAERWVVIGPQPTANTAPAAAPARSSTRWPRVSVPAGAGTVRVDFWIVYTSDTTVGAGGPITWNADGTPELPGDVVWMRRHQLEVEVRAPSPPSPLRGPGA